MKVYQTHTSAKLVCKPQDAQFLADDNFSGCPFSSNWKQVELMFEGRARPAMDFYGFGLKALVCSERVSLWSGALWDEGEFLPVRIAGRKGKYYIYNVTHCTSHLNPRKTIWAKDAPTGTRVIKSPAFHAERLGEDCVFKVPEDGATAIYCVERDDVPGHENLRALVKSHGLTGLEFKLVWSDKKERKSVKSQSQAAKRIVENDALVQSKPF